MERVVLQCDAIVMHIQVVQIEIDPIVIDREQIDTEFVATVLHLTHRSVDHGKSLVQRHNFPAGTSAHRELHRGPRGAALSQQISVDRKVIDTSDRHCCHMRKR